MAANKKKIERVPRKGTRRTTKTRAPSPILPIVTDQQVLENDARPLFEQAVRPWLTTPWTVHDYGMDAVVEVLTRRSGGDRGYHNTGRRIGIQLKASGVEAPSPVAVAVHVRTVRYWLASNEPFAVVFCHVPTRKLVYRWVDDALISELAARDAAWFTHDSVTIHLPSANVLSADNLEKFDRESRLVVVRRHRVLAPGTYDRLHDDAQRAMRDVLRCATEAGFESVVDQLKGAAERVRRATYVVGLAGRMRAGKSTLFNALVRRDISPVARRPTTAVPVFVTAGTTEEAAVAFVDGKTKTIAATAEGLAEYATQDENPDNAQGVRLITVRLISERLERGIAILDAPGLFDPSREIRDVTARALATASAVLFVIDVSSARSGGFAVESHTLDELEAVLNHSERLFLLLNKADELTDADRVDVTHTLDNALARRNLSSRLARPAMFISARKAWGWVSAGEHGASPIAELEAEIWDYLLATNSTGVSRLESAVGGSLKAVADSLEFLRMRRAGSEQARIVQERLARARSDISNLRSRCSLAKERAKRDASGLLRAELQQVPARITHELRVAAQMPTKEMISERVVQHVGFIFNGVWGNSGRALEQWGREVSQQLEAALDQVRLDHDPATMPVLLAPSFDLPAVSQLAPEAWGLGAVAALVAWAVAPAYAAVVAIGSFVLGAWMGHEKQREREIAKIEERIRGHVREHLSKPAGDLLDAIGEGYGRIDRYVEDRWGVFEKDARDQLTAAGGPLAPEEAKRLGVLEADLIRTRSVLLAVAEEIRWTPAPR